MSIQYSHHTDKAPETWVHRTSPHALQSPVTVAGAHSYRLQQCRVSGKHTGDEEDKVVQKGKLRLGSADSIKLVVTQEELFGMNDDDDDIIFAIPSVFPSDSTSGTDLNARADNLIGTARTNSTNDLVRAHVRQSLMFRMVHTLFFRCTY